MSRNRLLRRFCARTLRGYGYPKVRSRRTRIGYGFYANRRAWPQAGSVYILVPVPMKVNTVLHILKWKAVTSPVELFWETGFAPSGYLAL